MPQNIQPLNLLWNILYKWKCVQILTFGFTLLHICACIFSITDELELSMYGISQKLGSSWLSQQQNRERGLFQFYVGRVKELCNFLQCRILINVCFGLAVVACKPHMPPYLKALLPSDQVFEFEDDFSIPTCPTRGGPGPSRKIRSDAEGEEEENSEEGKENTEEGKGGETDTIDNPYLRPVKLPRKKKPKS
jgi:hypothetical protein